MERANKFFFLSGVVDNVVCDFKRMDDRMILAFCHGDDRLFSQRLDISIHSSKVIDNDSQKEMKAHFISYEIGLIQHGKSAAIYNTDLIWGIVTAIVNDVFKE